MNKDEALRMAIEALEMHVPHYVKDRGCEAINACKEALEPEIELADTISVEDYQKLREQPVVKDSLTAQKQWQGLSDDEIGEAQPPIDVKMSMDEFMDTFARAIEAKLKEKNT